LNRRRQLIGEEFSIGEMEKAPVYIKEIIRKALIKNATLIIMSHNHPGGSLDPSEEDQAVTKSLAAACSTVSVKCLIILSSQVRAILVLRKWIVIADRKSLACSQSKLIKQRVFANLLTIIYNE
jgi:DNA repair protein RadC